MNPADASRIVQRRSYTSSDSTTEDEATPRRVMVKKAGAAASSTSPMVPSPRLALSSPDGSGSSLLDHGYTRGTHEPRDEAATSMSSYSSAEINIRSLDRHLLHVTLSPSCTNATSPPNSLSANVNLLILLVFDTFLIIYLFLIYFLNLVLVISFKNVDDYIITILNDYFSI